MTLSASSFKAENIALFTTTKKIVLAYSGGLDSSVLLHLLSSQFDASQLIIWHINHQLQSNSNDMELFCRQQAKQYGLQFRCTRVELSQKKTNIESLAREARYQAFKQELVLDKDTLLTAHHANDQIETLLLNLSRGTGVLGLRGISNHGVIHGLDCLRPLIKFTQTELRDYALLNDLEWIEDPSNSDDHFDRNYLRHEVVPKLKQRWPSIINSFSQVADHQFEAAECLNELAQLDFQQCVGSHSFSQKHTLLLNEFMSLTDVRKKNLIRYWLRLYETQISIYQISLFMKVISDYKDGYKKVELPEGFIALYNHHVFYVEYVEIKDSKEVASWINKNNQYVSRLNKESHQISSHFLKRQFQERNVPPWLRDQTCFLLSKDKNKNQFEIKVL